MYTPTFPYKENQIILSSDRVLLHSKTDSIFLFGNSAIGLSSTKTINLDAIDKVLIDSPKIELGREAETLGEPIVLGDSLVRELKQLLESLIEAGCLLHTVSTTDPGASMTNIASAGLIIDNASSKLYATLISVGNPILSKTTFTR